MFYKIINTPYTFLIGSLMLILIGSVGLFDPLIVKSVTYNDFIFYIFSFIPDRLIFTFYFVIGLITLYSIFSNKINTIFSFILIQQLIWSLGIASIIWAIIIGQYSDGTVVSRTHIFVDQFIYIIFALHQNIHSFELFKTVLTNRYLKNE